MPLQSEQVPQRMMTRYAQIDELDVDTLRPQACFRAGAERRLLADLHGLHDRVAKKADANSSRLLNDAAFDVAQAERVDPDAGAVLLRPNSALARRGLEAEVLIRMPEQRLNDRKNS